MYGKDLRIYLLIYLPYYAQEGAFMICESLCMMFQATMTLWTVGVLGFLYFLQGMPYGIQVKFLPILLRANGVSLTNISLFKLLFLPWVFKVSKIKNTDMC